MSSTQSTSNPMDVRRVNIEFYRDSGIATARFSYGVDEFGTVSCPFMLKTISHSLALGCILHVINLIAYIKMLRIYAIAYITCVANVFADWNSSLRKYVCNSMRIAFMLPASITRTLYSSITGRKAVSNPKPTRRSLFRALSHSLTQAHYVFSHCIYLARTATFCKVKG